jgi:hypothetical protein
MKKLTFLLTASLFIATSCTKEDVFNTYDIDYKETITHNKDVQVTFQDIADSRCPTDVVCVWEGQAEVGLAVVFESNDSPTLFTLIKRAGYEELADTTLNGYHFNLLEVNPYPDSAGDLPQKEDYTIRLLIEAQ